MNYVSLVNQIYCRSRFCEMQKTYYVNIKSERNRIEIILRFQIGIHKYANRTMKYIVAMQKYLTHFMIPI